MDEIIRDKLLRLILGKNFESEDIRIVAKVLTPEEAIGNPEHDDYPLQKGKERLMQAEFRGSFGQAFTDMFGNYQSTLSEVLSMDLSNNFRRAIFVSSINAVARHLNMVDNTVHCKNEEPKRCADKLVRHIKDHYGSPKIFLGGLQPRMLEALSSVFDVRVTDLDSENIGKKKFGIMVESPDRGKEHMRWCDIALVTGTTLTNNTIADFDGGKPVIFFGVTIAGPARLLGLNHFCPFGA
ncbi:MAG: hypothetical protein JXB42_09365 [Deltaproteobacteria bacterium]|nr:hypothetical protein [Deltaproteobacteria bacterium]